MESFILALDQGTTSSRALLIDHAGQIRSIAQREFPQSYPRPGWVEQDPEDIWATQAGVIAEAVAHAGIGMSQISAIGIANQRETTLIWDRITGRPIYPAIVWQDCRTAADCDALKNAGLGSRIREKTGLIIDAYFSATKVKWILDQVDGARQAAAAGRLAFGTVDSWLVWKLTAGQMHVTDSSNASRTMLFNIHSREWDQDLLNLFGIPPSLLPQVHSSSQVCGQTAASLWGSSIPVAGIAGDQQAALFGQMCLQPGMVKHTYGTGGFMMLNTGVKAVVSRYNLLTTIAWDIQGTITYALEGSIFIAGAVVQWLRDGLGLISNSVEIERLAASVPDNGGVYFVPAFAGLGAPHWDQAARGTICGITRGTSAGHIARAALESIAYQTMDVLEAMAADTGLPIEELRVDGGASINDLLMQFQADLTGIRLVRPMFREATGLGAAYLAGLAVGYWSGVNELQQQWQKDRTFHPAPRANIHQQKRTWKRAVDCSKGWLRDES